MPRLSAAELDAARDRTIADVLPGPGDPPLSVLFCGINPGLVSAATGHHFARPGNRFWPVLHAAGFTPRLLRPAEQGELAGLGLGITNMAPRATARADELTAAELVAGGLRLRELVARAAARLARGRRDHGLPHGVRGAHAVVGPQEPLGATGVWVLPNPSGLNAHYQLPELTAAYAALREAAQSSSGRSSAPSSAASRSAHSSSSSSA